MVSLTTKRFIKLLKDDNQEELDRIYANYSRWSNINFDQVYDEIKDIEGNSSVYRALGAFIYRGGITNIVEPDMAKCFYYLKKSEKLGNKGAKTNIDQLLRISYSDDNEQYIDLAKDLLKMMDNHIELEKENEKLKKECARLEMENIDLRYRPPESGGPGYIKAEHEFNDYATSST